MKYRKKPVVVEAFQWYPYMDVAEMPDWFRDARLQSWRHSVFLDELVISTLEGEMKANPGDWVIKGVQGEFYPCKPDIFAATYEPNEVGQLRSENARLKSAHGHMEQELRVLRDREIAVGMVDDTLDLIRQRADLREENLRLIAENVTLKQMISDERRLHKEFVLSMSMTTHTCDVCGRERTTKNCDHCELLALRERAKLWEWLVEMRCNVELNSTIPAERWSVLDVDGDVIGTGPTPDDAIRNAMGGA